MIRIPSIKGWYFYLRDIFARRRLENRHFDFFVVVADHCSPEGRVKRGHDLFVDRPEVMEIHPIEVVVAGGLHVELGNAHMVDLVDGSFLKQLVERFFFPVRDIAWQKEAFEVFLKLGLNLLFLPRYESHLRNRRLRR